MADCVFIHRHWPAHPCGVDVILSDFNILSVLISSDSARFLLALLVKNTQAREVEVSTLPWSQTEKDIALASCRNGQRAWRNKEPVLTLSAVTGEEGHSLENEDESGRRLCEYWRTIFRARQEGPRHHQHEEILR